MLRAILFTFRVVDTVAMVLLASRAAVQAKYLWDERKRKAKKAERELLSIEDQLEVAMHVREIEEAAK